MESKSNHEKWWEGRVKEVTLKKSIIKDLQCPEHISGDWYNRECVRLGVADKVLELHGYDASTIHQQFRKFAYSFLKRPETFNEDATLKFVSISNGCDLFESTGFLTDKFADMRE